MHTRFHTVHTHTHTQIPHELAFHSLFNVLPESTPAREKRPPAEFVEPRMEILNRSKDSLKPSGPLKVNAVCPLDIHIRRTVRVGPS